MYECNKGERPRKFQSKRVTGKRDAEAWGGTEPQVRRGQETGDGELPSNSKVSVGSGILFTLSFRVMDSQFP